MKRFIGRHPGSMGREKRQRTHHFVAESPFTVAIAVRTCRDRRREILCAPRQSRKTGQVACCQIAEAERRKSRFGRDGDDSDGPRWDPMHRLQRVEIPESCATSAGPLIFGCIIPSGSPPTTATRSASASALSSALIRTHNLIGRLAAGRSWRKRLTSSRARCLPGNATLSSRSRITASAAQASTRASFDSLSPGTNSNERSGTGFMRAASCAGGPSVCNSPPSRRAG